MDSNKPMNEQESLKLITEMLQKAKNDYHESGISAIMWGIVVSAAGSITFLQEQFDFSIGFDIWLIVLAAIIPQIFISVREAKMRKFKAYDDKAMDAVWFTYAITIFGLLFYINIVPGESTKLMAQDGFQLIKRTIDGSKPDEVMQKPMLLSYTSLLILVYAFPTMITGWMKNCKPMIVGAVISYGLFIASCYTAFKYDMLLSAAAAVACWLIPGIILRIRYLKAKRAHV